MLQSALLTCSLGVVVGCVPTFDDNLSLVQEPTLLAVQSQPAEAAPGETVQLSALAATPDANGAAPQLEWGLCTARKPLTELGPVNPVCIQAPKRAPDSIIALGNGASVSATLPMDACRLFGPSLPEPMNGEPAGRPVDPDPTGGFYQPVGVTLPQTGVTSLGAVRIFCPPSGLDQEQSSAFNRNYVRNENPLIDSLALLDGSGASTPLPDEPASLHVAPNHVLHIQATWATCPEAMQACSGAETYAWFNPDSRNLETKHESIRVSWYANAGRFEHAVTGRDESEYTATTDDTWTAPATPTAVRFWLVIRDARGGQTFRTFIAQVQN